MKTSSLLLQVLLMGLCLLFTFQGKAQTTLYSENFGGQLLQGFTGPVAANSVFNSNNGKWSVTAAPIQGMFDANDHARVEDNVVGYPSTTLPTGNAFQFRDVDEPTTWRSQEVDISNYTSVNISLNIFEIGSLESTDFTEVAYILDGVRTVVLLVTDDYSDADGTGSSTTTDPGNVNPVVLNPSATGLSGNKIQIEVVVDVNSSSELPHIDNVLVEGFGFTPPVCTFQFASNSAVCDAFTSGIDTYTATFNYSGAGNGNYTVTSNAGTVVLDNNPNSVASGSFRVIGVPEGTDVTATINGVNCTNVTSTVTSPACGLPVPGALALTSLSLKTFIFPNMSWSAASNADSYTVQLSVGGGPFQDRAVLPASASSFTDTVALFGQNLTYKIKASNTSGFIISNSLTLAYPASVQPISLNFTCYDASTNELVWEVENPQLQNVPFIWAQFWSLQRDTLLAPFGSSEFRTLNNPQSGTTPGDDNITGIWWIDETLQAGEPNDIVFTANLGVTCAAGRRANPNAPQAPAWMVTNSLVSSLFSTVDVQKDIMAAQFNVGPNPFTDVIYIQAEELGGVATATLFDMAGKEVFRGEVNLSFQSEIQVNKLQAGMYLLQIGTSDGAFTTKMVKK